MDKYLNRSRNTAINSVYEPSYLYSSAKVAALSRYNPILDISPIKLDLDITAKTHNYLLVKQLDRASAEQIALKVELNKRRAIQSKKILELRDQIQINQNLLNVQRDKQRGLVDDLSIVQLQISELLKKRQQRVRIELKELEELDVRSSDVKRDLQDSQFRLDAHEAMIRGLQKMAITGN